jgi:2-polyprenyl-3-methyl-5-hydroxy-6-metoxy-1,4-benzoquinol methylase
VSALISELYKRQNEELHATKTYGAKGHFYARNVAELAAVLGTTDVLDYGCGRGTMGKSLPFPIREYDPCIEGKDSRPDPADIVVCTDVLEHIEPDCLEAVLDDIKRVTRHVAFLTIDTRPARKFLSDGRNAHLIQEGPVWWFPKLIGRWDCVKVQNIILEADKSDQGIRKNLGFLALCS